MTVAVAFIAIMIMNAVNPLALGMGGRKTIALETSQLTEKIKGGQIEKANWQQNEISGTLADGKTRFTATVPPPNDPAGAELLKLLNEYKVPYNIEKPPISAGVIGFLSMFAVPAIFIFLIWFFFIRPAQAGGNQALSFGRSKAKRVGETGTKITFEDVAGIDEAKQELYEIVDFLKNTKKYVALGAKIPKGILLTGPPGVGKTHLARAIAGEAGVPFFHISGSDFVEMFVGVGAARVRDLFETAKAHRPCLIFVDEIDAVGRQRGAGLGGGHDEREQTLNQLLVEMDGFDPNAGVILIAATNRPDVLDPALLRPGRFDRQLVVDPPDARGREAILLIHSKGKPLDPDVNMETVAKRTPGFTGADLANSLNEAALLAARRNQSRITMLDVEEALDRVMAGPQRKSRVIDAKEREVIAYHEAGHAIVGELLEGCDPVHKVTILPRGMSLGSTWQLPEQDKFIENEQELLDDICALLGGREAEEVVYGTVWTGSSSDLERVTRIARAMVTQFGMSKRLGTLAIGRRSSNPFLGRDYYEERNYSEDVAKLIDDEVHNIVSSCRDRTKKILLENRDKLDAMVKALLERETLNREDFLLVLGGKALPPMRPALDSPAQDTGAEGKDADKSAKRVPPPRFEPDPA
ncbi:MAG TPA: ATP-dependent zinc metalloprotease FtsH [Fimbriimonadaceae bacterium]|nr:ATP-dependent zinc metalloprotease FtsH [Fimbriimonadaceae bacterium]HRJ96753.1 ATP-dependent zinc metalloprotease FtsH [Fimbriimonadaceae bacterium]